MSNKKRSRKSGGSSTKTGQNTYVRVVAIVIIVLVVIAAFIVIATFLKPTGNASQQPKLVGTKEYSSAPPMLIDQSKQYTATVKMAKGGEFVIQLYADKAPITVNSFVFLARQG